MLEAVHEYCGDQYCVRTAADVQGNRYQVYPNRQRVVPSKR